MKFETGPRKEQNDFEEGGNRTYVTMKMERRMVGMEEYTEIGREEIFFKCLKKPKS